PFTLAPSGGTAPYTFSNAVLPPGLTMSPGGTISGTPTTAGGTFSSSVRVTDASQIAQTFPLQIQIQAANPLTITSSAFTARQGMLLTGTLSAAGGSPSYIWTLAGGTSLTGTGLSLDSAAGIISGIPSGQGTISLQIRVTDSLGVTATVPLTIT